MSSLQDRQQAAREDRERKLRLGMGPRPNIVPFPPAFPPVEVKPQDAVVVPIQNVVVIPTKAETVNRLVEIECELRQLRVKIRSLRDIAEGPSDDAPIPTRTVILTVAKYYGIPPSDIYSKSRFKPLMRPRHVAMYLATEITGYSFTTLGRVFKKDHTSIMHGHDKIDWDRRHDLVLDTQINELTALLTGEPSNV